jgi:HTH-type transcriptional regulator/antitoxin HigA
MSARNDTAEGDELDVLATLVDAYEREHYPIDAPDPVDAIKFRMEQMGLSRKDLEPFLGSRARVSEVMNKRRGLSLAMIRSLHENLEIPLDALIGRES